MTGVVSFDQSVVFISLKRPPRLYIGGTRRFLGSFVPSSAAYSSSNCGSRQRKAAFTPDICRRIQVLSSVLLADTSGYM